MLLSMKSITASKPRSKRGSLQSGTRLPPFLHSPSLPRPTQPLALTERLHVSCVSMLCCVTPLPLSMLGLSGKRQKKVSLVLEKGKASCTARHCHVPPGLRVTRLLCSEGSTRLPSAVLLSTLIIHNHFVCLFSFFTSKL